DPWWDEAIPIRFHDEARSIRSIVDALAASPPDGVIAVGDRPVTIAARVNEVLGLRGNPPMAAFASRNKLESRRMLQSVGLPVPAFLTLAVNDDPRERAVMLDYPVVVKPLAMSGSRGVIRADDTDAFVRAVDRIRTLLGQADVRAERDSAHG